jgi:hypothetical protein
MCQCIHITKTHVCWGLTVLIFTLLCSKIYAENSQSINNADVPSYKPRHLQQAPC